MDPNGRDGCLLMLAVLVINLIVLAASAAAVLGVLRLFGVV